MNTEPIGRVPASEAEASASTSLRPTPAAALDSDPVPDLAALALLTGIRVDEKSQRHNAIPAKALIESAPVALYHTDAAGNMTYSNPEYRRMFGLSVGHGPDAWAERLHPADRGRMEALWAEFCRAPKPCRFDGYRTFADDGSVRHFTEQVVPAEGVPGWVGTITDLTELVVAREELERVHKQLVLASRQAGMAEVATNVLHNVGNILNSINISASLVAERIKQSRAEGVARLASLLEEKRGELAGFLTADERGRRIPEYLSSLGQQLADDQRAVLEELDSLRGNLEHIKDTVTMQQSYAKLCGVTETLAVADLVEDSLRLNAGAFVRHGVALERHFEDVPPITVDKHKVLQILVNLIRNAKYACDESGRSDKRITLRIEPCQSGVRIAVCDNGAGIHPGHMARLFTHGFTTRASGHGFGLHSGALAAQDLGGTLSAESDGPGRGATFVLELPLQAADGAHA